MTRDLTLHDLLEKMDELKKRLEHSRTRQEKEAVLMEFRFLLDAADQIILSGP